MISHTTARAFGGAFVPETLVGPLAEIGVAFAEAVADQRFNLELDSLLRDFAGRATPLYYARRLSEAYGCRLFLKREDLLHGGAHKTNNTLGQALLAQRMGKTRLIAETGAGQHGVATAMAGALVGLPVEVYMGTVDMARQQPNVQRMQLFGARVHGVDGGTATLKDAINEAMRDWIATAGDTYYVFGTAAGPDPFPGIVRHFQEVIGREARAQIMRATGALPQAVMACVGGGSNAIGMFSAFIDDVDVRLVGAEAAGHGIESGRHAATLQCGTPGVFHGSYSLFLQNDDGQIADAHSISAGLDYPGVGPEHARLQAAGRAEYVGVTDGEALAACQALARKEGILGALESAHAVAVVPRIVPELGTDAVVLVNLSGRGDKDLDTLMKAQVGP